MKGAGFEGGSLHRRQQEASAGATIPTSCFDFSLPVWALLSWGLLPVQRTQEDLQQLQSELRVLSERCCSFLDKAPAGPSTPHLRSELDLVVNKMEQTHGLSSIYLEK